MKTTFIVFKKRLVLIFLCFLTIVIFCVTYIPIKANASPKPRFTIVIDAGHGGADGGAIGKVTKITESEINLEYAQTLKQICENFGMKVVMTRKDMNGLYNPLATNKKRSDMEKRKQIIDQSGADLVVSIHMNSFPRRSSRGAQVFYGLDSTRGKSLAEKVQSSLQQIDHAKSTPKEGDFYILNCTPLPAILVECGFLSNSEEEALLVTSEYRQKLCYHIASGILSFYEM